jgi:CBS domain-containing protein
MRDEHVGDLVVIEEDNQGKLVPIGILTDRDIVVGVLARDLDHLRTLDVGDVVTRDIVTAKESEDLSDVLDRMGENGIRRMPVVDATGELVGIFTLDDWLGGLSRDLHNVRRLVQRERREETHRRP